MPLSIDASERHLAICEDMLLASMKDKTDVGQNGVSFNVDTGISTVFVPLEGNSENESKPALLRLDGGVGTTGILIKRTYNIIRTKGTLGIGSHEYNKYEIDSYSGRITTFSLWGNGIILSFAKAAVEREKAKNEKITSDNKLVELNIAAKRSEVLFELSLQALGYRYKNYYLGDDYHGFVPIEIKGEILRIFAKKENRIAFAVSLELNTDIAFPLLSESFAGINAMLMVPWKPLVLKIVVHGKTEYSYNYATGTNNIFVNTGLSLVIVSGGTSNSTKR